jgi:hypothetical protein
MPNRAGQASEVGEGTAGEEDLLASLEKFDGNRQGSEDVITSAAPSE